MNTVHNLAPRAARQQKVREEIRRVILEAALELFVEQGYDHVSIRTLATNVGYSPAAIYRYFPSKDDIFFALAEEGLRLLNAGDPANTPSADPLADIRATAQRFYDFSKEQPQLFALIFLDMRVPRIGAEYGRFEFMGPIWQQLEARVVRCIEAGLLPRTLEPFVALRILSAPIFGLAAQEISGRLEADENVDALVHDVIEVTIAGLRAGAQKQAATPNSVAANAVNIGGTPR
jgi:AcrR family transcriptional regulator